MTDTRVVYESDLRCRAEHGESGTIVLTDLPKDHQGQARSFSPSEMLSVSLGSCILSMMALSARAMGFELGAATASIDKTMANTPRRIVALSVEIDVPGTFDAAQRRRLEAAAHACPVHQILAIEAPIRIRWADQGETA